MAFFSHLAAISATLRGRLHFQEGKNTDTINRPLHEHARRTHCGLGAARGTRRGGGGPSRALSLCLFWGPRGCPAGALIGHAREGVQPAVCVYICLASTLVVPLLGPARMSSRALIDHAREGVQPVSVVSATLPVLSSASEDTVSSAQSRNAVGHTAAWIGALRACLAPDLTYLQLRWSPGDLGRLRSWQLNLCCRASRSAAVWATRARVIPTARQVQFGCC
ncbi:unnamed protein product [Prorocentrum cordatum]|uniref:Uncharacterized protein n=1 Tax=Prorocentrum cordatum TaxID=2364126 RepID=A0ABN9W4E8_9DINO|nr:unnamed protein product [Polarella glacialis]